LGLAISASSVASRIALFRSSSSTPASASLATSALSCASSTRQFRRLTTRASAANSARRPAISRVSQRFGITRSDDGHRSSSCAA
jgi:hypothetical protein